MNVCYQGPVLDYSGYGEASRHHVAALHAAGVNVIVKSVSYNLESSDFGEIGLLMNKLQANEGDYKIKILHMTPDQYKKHLEPGKYHVGAFYWETDNIPADFAAGLNLVDEIWTASEANAKAIKAGGCGKPVHIFPQAIETERKFPPKYELPDFDGFLFYSIFEWTDRKNPLGLLDAYWREFQGDENVGLLIKTYFRNFTLQNKRTIRMAIDKAKARSGLDKFPPVFLYMDLMDRKHIERLHSTGDCYVSPHRGEGWGLPVAEAALAGNQVITTAYGGIGEWFKKEQAAMTLDFTMVPLKGMDHSMAWYSHDQKWADPDSEAIRANMRLAFEQGPEVDQIRKRGQKLVQSRFSLPVVGAEMSGRLKDIEQEISPS